MYPGGISMWVVGHFSGNRCQGIAMRIERLPAPQAVRFANF